MRDETLLLTRISDWRDVFLTKATVTPCSLPDLRTFAQMVQGKLGQRLPDVYLHFLTESNGYNEGELMIYGTKHTFQKATHRLIYGLLEMNVDFHHVYDGVVLGEWGAKKLTYDASYEKPYAIISRFGYAEKRTISWDALLNLLSKERLNTNKASFLRQPANGYFDEIA